MRLIARQEHNLLLLSVHLEDIVLVVVRNADVALHHMLYQAAGVEMLMWETHKDQECPTHVATMDRRIQISRDDDDDVVVQEDWNVDW